MARTLAEHLDPNVGPKRILSLSGGGVRGLVTLGALETLEQHLIQESGSDDVRLSDHFDLIAGTSTGSIIATGLALGWRVEQIQDLYDELCPVLFKPNNRLGFFRPKFDAEPLANLLKQKLQNEKGEPIRLGSPELKTGLLICAKRMDTDSAWLLTNNFNSKFHDAGPGQTWLPNKLYPLASIVQASAAAPSFLEPVVINIEEAIEGYAPEQGVFVDGAIGGHNCPAFAAYQIATLNSYGFNWKTGEENLSILSIGTGQYRVRRETKDFLNQRTVNQSVSALMGLINESQRNTLLTMQALSMPDKPWHINSEVAGLANEMMVDKAMFRFRHVDIALDDKTDMRARLKLEADTRKNNKKFAKAQDALKDMANGRKDNLANAKLLGRSLGADISRDDLFLYPEPVLASGGEIQQ